MTPPSGQGGDGSQRGASRAQRFRTDAGPICNCCRAPSTIEAVIFSETESSPASELVSLVRTLDPPTDSELTSASKISKAIERTKLQREASRVHAIDEALETMCHNCLEAPIDAVNAPCRHAMHCMGCAQRIAVDNGGVCPKCAQPATLGAIETVKTCGASRVVCAARVVFVAVLRRRFFLCRCLLLPRRRPVSAPRSVRASWFHLRHLLRRRRRQVPLHGQ